MSREKWLNKWVTDLSGIKGLVTDVSNYPLVIVSFPNGQDYTTRFLNVKNLTIVNETEYVEQMAKDFISEIGFVWEDTESAARNIARHAVKKITELKRWKQEVISIMPDYQKIGELLNVPFGSSISNIIPKIQELKSVNKELLEALKAFHAAKANELTIAEYHFLGNLIIKAEQQLKQ